MSDVDRNASLEEVVEKIVQLEHERTQIYEDSQVTNEEHPRLAEIKHELNVLWDLRRRLEAAKAAGLDRVPVMPSTDPSNMTG